MSVVVYDNADDAAAKHVKARRAVRKQQKAVQAAAIANLLATEHTPRIAGVNNPADEYFPAEIETEEHDVDCFVILHAPDAMALEFGHAPSGFFDPDKPGMGLTRPPAAEYILTRAAHSGATIG